ncbi:LacI family DNA-binding transcriptional regulator [Lacibacterium aquatile]|uniref:LacI family DNA-binding transcriptional regulator n=1 Tax=Lacibacterium aquatile TaxID=1168082 RepID=A0ABW5DLI7_9PROT
MTRSATIRDVAKLAGVSTATVSRAIAEPALVSADTREAVLKAAAEINYTPNLLARNLRQQRTKSILVLVEDIANPFYPEIFHAMEEAAQQRGYTVLLGNTGHSNEREQGYWDLVRAKRADGVVLFTGQLPEGTDPKRLPPVVLMAERIAGATLPLVAIDNEEAAARATRHLVDLGHRRIAHISGPQHRVISRDRLAGWRRAMDEAGLPLTDDLLVPGEFTIPGGEAAMRQLMALPDRPTAVFAANDESAVGALRAAQRLGLDVPRDVSLVGFDDIALAALFDPALTTIRQPRPELGDAAMRLIIDRIEGKGTPTAPTILPAPLIERGSTAKRGTK